MTPSVDPYRLVVGDPVPTTMAADNTRLLDACASWGTESAWYLHRLQRLTVEREALFHWLNTHDVPGCWDDPTFRRRRARYRSVCGQLAVTTDKLAEIGDKVDAMAKRNPKQMGHLTSSYFEARDARPRPPLAGPPRRKQRDA